MNSCLIWEPSVGRHLASALLKPCAFPSKFTREEFTFVEKGYHRGLSVRNQDSPLGGMTSKQLGPGGIWDKPNFFLKQALHYPRAPLKATPGSRWPSTQRTIGQTHRDLPTSTRSTRLTRMSSCQTSVDCGGCTRYCAGGGAMGRTMPAV